MPKDRVSQSKRDIGAQQANCGYRESKGGEGTIREFNERNGKVSTKEKQNSL